MHEADNEFSILKQLTFGDADFASKGKKTRKERFLARADCPWPALIRQIAPLYPESGNARRPYPLATMLRIHLMQNWFALSDPAMEGALLDMPALRQFAGLSSQSSIPDETTILNLRHLIEEHDIIDDTLACVDDHHVRKSLMIKRGATVDATIIDAPT